MTTRNGRILGSTGELNANATATDSSRMSIGSPTSR